MEYIIIVLSIMKLVKLLHESSGIPVVRLSSQSYGRRSWKFQEHQPGNQVPFPSPIYVYTHVKFLYDITIEEDRPILSPSAAPVAHIATKL